MASNKKNVKNISFLHYNSNIKISWNSSHTFGQKKGNLSEMF